MFLHCTSQGSRVGPTIWLYLPHSEKGPGSNPDHPCGTCVSQRLRRFPLGFCSFLGLIVDSKLTFGVNVSVSGLFMFDLWFAVQGVTHHLAPAPPPPPRPSMGSGDGWMMNQSCEAAVIPLLKCHLFCSPAICSSFLLKFLQGHFIPPPSTCQRVLMRSPLCASW